MADQWNDINVPTGFKKKDTKAPAATNKTAASEPEEEKKPDKPEVKLIEAIWKPGSKGFEFDKECILKVKAQFLAKTAKRKVSARLFVVFQGNKEDVSYTGEGELNDAGEASIKIKLYQGKAYSDAARDDPQATCSYICTVSHPTAEKSIESKQLEMPESQCVFFLDLRYFNPLKTGDDRFCYLPKGIRVSMWDHDTTSADDFQAEGTTDGTGPTCLKIKRKDEENPDLYFVIHTKKKYINLETGELVDSVQNPSAFPFIALPESIDSRAKTAADGKNGYLKGYTGKGEGTKNAPWRFDLEDIKVFLSLKYFKDSEADFAPMPQGLCVTLYDRDWPSKDDKQAGSCILDEGKVYLPVFVKDEEKPDLYFNVVNPGGAYYLDKEAGSYVKTIDKTKPEQFVKLPAAWVSKDRKDAAGNDGIRNDCPGDVESWETPWEFIVAGGVAKAEWNPPQAVVWDDEDRADMKPCFDVETMGIPDGAKASIEIFQFEMGGAHTSIGKVTDLKVKGDKIVDGKGNRPEYRFPWHATIYDYKRTQYFFKVTIDAVVKTSTQDVASMLELKHHDSVVSNPDGSLPGTEGASVNTYLSAMGPWIDATADSIRATGHAVEYYSGTATEITVSFFKKLMERHLFLHHQDSHGMAYCTNHVFSNKWLEKSSTQGADGVTEWFCPDCKNNKHAVGFICCAEGEYVEASDVKGLKRSPKILLLSSSCLTAISDVFPKEWTKKGTRWYIGWAVPVGVSAAEGFSKDFYAKWMETYSMDPDKVSDAFDDVKAPYLNWRPKIYHK